MKFHYKYKNKSHTVECDNLSSLPMVMRERIPEILDFQNFRYSLRISTNVDNEQITFVVAICHRENPFNFLTFEQLHVNTHVDRFVTASPPFESFEDAVNHFNMLTEMFESETGVTLRNNKKTTKRRKTKTEAEYL